MEAKFLVEAADTPLTPEGTRLVRGVVSAFEWGSLGKWGETQELPLPPGAVSVPLPEEALPRLRLSAWEVEDGIYRMEARLAFSLEGGEREVLVFSKSGDIGDYAQHTASREALTDGDREEILGAHPRGPRDQGGGPGPGPLGLRPPPPGGRGADRLLPRWPGSEGGGWAR